MANPQPLKTTNLNRYDDEAMPWASVIEALAATYPDPPVEGTEQHTVLGTVRPDGRPHAAPVGAFWIDGSWYIVSGPGTRKSRNIEANPACTLTAKLRGMDVVFTGEAQRVTDRGELERDNGWPAEVEGDAFIAPYMAQSGGPPPWNLYRLKLEEAVAVGTSTDISGATKYTF